MKNQILNSLKNWLTEIDAKRTEVSQRVELGRHPCKGGSYDADCINCGEELEHHTKMNGKLFCLSYSEDTDEYKRNYPKNSKEHDWDGGQCWRCNGYYPPYHDPNENHGMSIANTIEPDAHIPESMVREIVKFLEEN